MRSVAEYEFVMFFHLWHSGVAGACNGSRYLVCDYITQYQHSRDKTRNNDAENVKRYFVNAEAPKAGAGLGNLDEHSTHVVELNSKLKACLVQKIEFPGLDLTRSQSFGCFGFAYACGPGYVIYNLLYPKWSWFHALAPLTKAVLDTSINCPFVFFPLFYVTREIIFRDRLDVPAAVVEWKKHFIEDYIASFSVWVPFMFVAFRFVPLKYLWPYMSAAGIIWSFILTGIK